MLQVIAGRDPNDSTSTTTPVPDYVAELSKPVSGMRIGIPKQYFGEGMDGEVRKKIEAGIEILKKLGCKLIDIEMPHTDYAIAVYYIIATAEASSNLARYDGVRYGLRVNDDSLLAMYRKTRGAGFGAEVKRRIVLGTYVLSAGYYDAYYLKGQKVRALIAQGFPRRVHQSRCDRHADFAGARVQTRRTHQRSAANVSRGHLYGDRLARGHSGNFGALREGLPGTSPSGCRFSARRLANRESCNWRMHSNRRAGPRSNR